MHSGSPLLMHSFLAVVHPSPRAALAAKTHVYESARSPALHRGRRDYDNCDEAGGVPSYCLAPRHLLFGAADNCVLIHICGVSGSRWGCKEVRAYQADI